MPGAGEPGIQYGRIEPMNGHILLDGGNLPEEVNGQMDLLDGHVVLNRGDHPAEPNGGNQLEEPNMPNRHNPELNGADQLEEPNIPNQADALNPENAPDEIDPPIQEEPQAVPHNGFQNFDEANDYLVDIWQLPQEEVNNERLDDNRENFGPQDPQSPPRPDM